MTVPEIIGIAAPTSGALAWVGAKLAASVKQRTEAALEQKRQGDVLEQIQQALESHRLESRQNLSATESRLESRMVATEERIESRLERVEFAVDKIASGQGSERQAIAGHDATLSQHETRLVRVEARQSTQMIAQRDGTGSR